MLDLYGRHDWIRTSDLFRVKKWRKPQVVDGTLLKTGTTGKNGPLGGICDKNATNFLRAFGLAVWDQAEEYRSNRTS